MDMLKIVQQWNNEDEMEEGDGLAAPLISRKWKNRRMLTGSV